MAEKTTELKTIGAQTGEKYLNDVSPDKVYAWYQEAEGVHNEWKQKARLDYAFHKGDQWDSVAKAELTAAKRPCLTYNIIRPLVKLLTGYERSTRYDIQILPVEDSDAAGCKLRQQIIKMIETQNMAEYKYSFMYLMGVIGGRGWVEIDIDREDNILGEITVKEGPPDQFILDPYTYEYDLMDSKYLIREKRYDEDELGYLYPKQKDKIATIKANFPWAVQASGGRDFFKVWETWYRIRKKVYILVDTRTGDTNDIPEASLEETKAKIEHLEHLAILSKTKQNVFYTVTSGGDLEFESGRSPYRHKYLGPYINFFPEFDRPFDEDKPDWVGIVRDLRDVQTKKNKRRSQYLDILLKHVAGGWMVEEGALPDIDALRDLGVKNQTVVKFNVGGIAKVQQYVPKAPASELLSLEERTGPDTMDVTGINKAMLGMIETSREAAASIDLKQKAGLTILSPFQDNMRRTRYIIAKVFLALIPQVYNTTRILRIVAPGDTWQQLKVNEEVIDPKGEIEKILNDVTCGKYDAVIADNPSTPTSRHLEFLQMLEALKMGVQINPKRIVKASDWLCKEEIIQDIEQAEAQAAAQAEAMAAAGGMPPGMPPGAPPGGAA